LRAGSPHPWPLRWHLSLLIGGTLLPVVAFSALVLLQLAGEMRGSAERRLQRSASRMNAAFERETSATIRTLQALAQSASLDGEGDLERFTGEAQRVWHTQPSWLTVILLNPDGEQLVNLKSGKASPRPPATEPASLWHTVETHQPSVGVLALSPGSGRWAFPVRVPVMRDGQLRYVLTAVIPAEALADVVANQQPLEEEEFTRTVVDSAGLVVFRTRNPERFIGTPASSAYRERTRETFEGVFRTTTLDGTSAYAAFSRSASSGWTFSVGVPVAVFDGPFRRSLWAIAASGVLALLVSTAGALSFARRFARGIRSVEVAAEALALGGHPQLERSGLAEVDRVGRSLGVSAERLRQHAQEEQKARQALEEAVRARDEFLSLASHELKTPLTAMVLQAQVLQRRIDRGDPLQPESARKLIDQTSRQTQRLVRLVDDMLDISRLSGGKLTLEKETVDLAALASEVLTKLGPVLSAAQCQVSLKAPEPVTGTWDRYRLEQVLTNLLTNAARYGAGTPVEVSVRRVEHGAELRVKDGGRGIAQADQERIFRKFERAVGLHEVSGLGLGLFIVRELVELHAGTIRVESQPGQGATFIVLLP
jgi:signal transduction histidine kinase